MDDLENMDDPLVGKDTTPTAPPAEPPPAPGVPVDVVKDLVESFKAVAARPAAAPAPPPAPTGPDPKEVADRWSTVKQRANELASNGDFAGAMESMWAEVQSTAAQVRKSA